MKATGKRPIGDFKELILDAWKLDHDQFEFRAYVSSSVDALLNDAKPTAKLFETILAATQVHAAPFEVNEPWETYQSQFAPTFTDKGVHLNAAIDKRTIQRGRYLFLITPSHETSSARIELARSSICSLLGHAAAFQETHRFSISLTKNHTSFASNSVRLPTNADFIALIPREGALDETHAALSQAIYSEGSGTAFNYFCKALDEPDNGLKMFLFILSIESVGAKNDFSSAITAAYTPPLKNAHKVRSYFNLDWYREFRNEFAHKALAREYDGQKERLIQLLFMDAVAFRFGSHRLGLGKKFLEDFSE